MKKLIIDCDNTFGIDGCDIDDGLTIIYAIGSGNCEVLGVNTTFGNSTLDIVYPNTVKFMKNIGQAHIPVFRGHESRAEKNDAARFLVDTVNKYPGEISVLAIGSLTNLYHAWLLDNTFYSKLVELSLMGGVTAPLIIGGKQLDELNFSCDTEASLNVLTNAERLIVATGNACLGAFFEKSGFDKLKSAGDHFTDWLYDESVYWYKREREVFGHDGVYKWDIYACAALLEPTLFDECIVKITPDMDSLKTGSLFGTGIERKINVPKLKNPEIYKSHVYETYKKFGVILSKNQILEDNT